MKRLLFFALIALSSLASAAECFTYGAEIALRGILSRHTFAEQPNYESIANGDAAATYFFLTPKAPICVLAGNVNEGEYPASGVRRLQLIFPLGKDGFGPLRPYLGKTIKCRGSLFHSMSGHHHSAVLIEGAKCHAL